MTNDLPLRTEDPQNGEVVAVVVTWRGRIGLFRRSKRVSSDAGRWHCITGFVERDETPLEGAARELHEETGLAVRDLSLLRDGPVLTLVGQDGGEWLVHTFLAATDMRRLRLNYEHDAYRWVSPGRLARFDGQVAWLRDVLRAVTPDAQAVPGLANVSDPSLLII